MATKTTKTLEPVLRLLEINKQNEITKLKEEKIFPLLEKFEKERKSNDRMEEAVRSLNKVVDEINEEIDNVNKLYLETTNARGYKYYSKINHYLKPNSPSYVVYNYKNKSYSLNKVQFDEVSAIDKEITSKIEIKYLTLEAKILLEKDFAAISKILTDNNMQ